MVKIAICFSSKADNAFVYHEIEQCFAIRNVIVSILTCHNTDPLLHHQLLAFRPDILIYHIGAQSESMIRCVLSLKGSNPDMISIITGNTSLLTVHEYGLLQPIFEWHSQNRKHLWEYAHKAYDLSLKDSHTFTYYRRPEYVSTPLTNILYFASEARRIHLVSTDFRNSFYSKLDDVELLLQHKSCHFVRIHKSYLVNTKYIADFTKKSLFLKNGEILKISSYSRYKDILSAVRTTRIS